MTNILILLFLSQAWAEWVEISQQHYRKPIRTHSVFTASDKVLDVVDTTRTWTYSNRSVTEYNWNKSPTRAPNIGDVKRVQLNGSTVKTTERIKLEDKDSGLDVDILNYEFRPNYGSTKTTTEFNEYKKQKDTIERVPNFGNIKRVRLNNSSVKSPAVNFNGERKKSSNNRYKSGLRDGDLQTEINDFKDKNAETFSRRIYVNKFKKHHGTERTATFPPNEDETTTIAQEVTKDEQKYKNRSVVNNLHSTKPTFNTENEKISNYETQQNRFYKITNRKTSEETNKNNVYTTENADNDEDGAIKPNIRTTTTTEKNIENINKNAYDFKAESHENKVQASANDENQANIIANDLSTKSNVKGDKAAPINGQSKNGKDEDNKGIKDGKLKGVKTRIHKVNTMENVIKFMRVVADTISKNSRRSFGGKMQYLHELKDSILANIEEHIDSAWPDDDSAGARRHSRSAQASLRDHHVHFPSSESALMTISFLTFAVFLIKLVLQVVQTYKHKAMMVAPVVVAASGRSVFTQQGHH